MLNVSLIGFGYWGPNIAKNLTKLQNINFFAIVDKQTNKLDEIKKQYPSVIINSELNSDILEHTDAFIIATPIETHYNIAKFLLQQDKHVLIQKPMAHSSLACEELNTIADKRKLVLMVAHTFLFSPSIQKIKHHIESGEYGNLHYISSQRINLGLFQRYHNVVWDLAPHDFSILRYLYPNRPKFISAIGKSHSPSNLVDIANISIGYDNEFIANIQINWLSPFKIRNIIVCGEKRTTMYDDCAVLDKVKIFDAGFECCNDVFSYRKGDIHIPKLEDKEPIFFECMEFVSSILENRQPISDGIFSQNIVEMIEITNKSIENNGIPIYL